MSELLTQLDQTIEDRRSADPSESYVAKLCHSGEDEILKKVAEEAAEVIIASKSMDPTQLIHEVADVLFHMMVLLRYKGLSFQDIEKELENRFGQSGILEKSLRSTANSG